TVMPASVGCTATVTPASAVLNPAVLVAVSVNMVVTATSVVTSPASGGPTAPMFGSIERPVAQLTFHERTTEPPPAGRELGVARKLLIVGAPHTVTVAL